MKKTLLIGTVVILVLASCENHSFIADDENFLKLDNGLEYNFSDFELYDSSTHIFYFKTDHPEFKTEKASNFSVSAYGEEIYNGVFWPPYSSTLPFGPYIDSFLSLYHDYAFRIHFLSIDHEPKDTRNDPRIIAALKDHNLLHSGLSLVINSIGMNGIQLTFKFTVTNQDMSELLILDPDKVGTNLFHYFTNGLYLRDFTNNEVFSANVTPQVPDPWDSWNIEWLSVIKSGESRQFTINYEMKSLLVPGEYKALFEFPGLNYNVSKEQLNQGSSRIWLGDVQTIKMVTIQ